MINIPVKPNHLLTLFVNDSASLNIILVKFRAVCGYTQETTAETHGLSSLHLQWSGKLALPGLKTVLATTAVLHLQFYFIQVQNQPHKSSEKSFQINLFLILLLSIGKHNI